MGDKCDIATVLFEQALDEIKWTICPTNFIRQISAFNFIVKDHKIINVECSNKPFEYANEGMSYSHDGESRTEVFEILGMLKSMISLKVFL